MKTDALVPVKGNSLEKEHGAHWTLHSTLRWSRVATDLSDGCHSGSNSKSDFAGFAFCPVLDMLVANELKPITRTSSTTENQMLTLNSAQLQQYREAGYCLVRNLIPTAVIEPVRTRILAMIETPPAWGKDEYWQALDPHRYQNKAGQPIPSGIQEPSKAEAVFKTMADHPNLAAAMSQLLGGAVQRSTDQIGVKHGCITEAQGGCSFYHQDSYYWHLAPELGCNCWIPMDSVNTDAIALAVMPGSQKSWQLDEHERYFDDPAIGVVRNGKFTPFQRFRIPSQNVDFTKEILLPMEPGDGLFFTNYTWHRSEPNRTGQTKSFYAIAYKRTAPAS